MTVQHEQSLIAFKCATDNASSQSHVTLKNTFDPLDPTQSADSQRDYRTIADGWDAAVQDFAARIRRSSQSAWSGNAASTAQESIADYATDALNLTPTLKELSTRVDEAITAVSNTKRNLTPYSDDPQSWWNPGDWFDGNPEADAEESARKVVQQQYVAPIVEADQKIPILPKPKDPTNPEADPGAGDPGTNPGGGNPGTTTNPGTLSTTQPSTTTTPSTTEQPTTSQGADTPGTTTTPTTTTPTTTNPATTTTASTTPAGLTPVATVPTTTTPGTGSPGTGVPGSGTPGLGTVGTGTPGTGAPGSGRTLSGAPGAAGTTGTTGANSGRSAGSTAGRSGMPGMGGMGNRGGGNGTEDDEHKIPDYLIQDRETELLGVQPRVLPPGGVIGG